MVEVFHIINGKIRLKKNEELVMLFYPYVIKKERKKILLSLSFTYLNLYLDIFQLITNLLFGMQVFQRNSN